MPGSAARQAASNSTRTASDGRPVPIQQQRNLAQAARIVEDGQDAERGSRRAAANFDQRIGRKLIERSFVASLP
jgi:hypothetical protein